MKTEGSLVSIWSDTRKRVKERRGWIGQMTKVFNDSGDTATYLSRQRLSEQQRDAYNEAINSEWFAEVETDLIEQIRASHLAIIEQLPGMNDPLIAGEIMRHRQTIVAIKDLLTRTYQIAKKEDDERVDLLNQEIKEAELAVHTIPRI